MYHLLKYRQLGYGEAVAYRSEIKSVKRITVANALIILRNAQNTPTNKNTSDLIKALIEIFKKVKTSLFFEGMNLEDKEWLGNWPLCFKQEVILNSVENEQLAAFIEDDTCSSENCAELFDMTFLDNNFSQYNYLRNTKFSDPYIPLLYFILVKNDILKMLRLAGNINFTIFSCMADAIKKHPSLHDIELSGNNLGDQAAPIIASILKSNTRIHSFFLGDNNITDIGAQILLEALRHNFSILIFNLEENPISAGILQQINEILERNKSHLASINTLVPPQITAAPAYP